MNTIRRSLSNKLNNEFFKTHFNGNANTTGLCLCILLILTCLLILVGILS
jgi:hypothetical protein